MVRGTAAQMGANDDTITGHATLGSPNTVLQRIDAQAFQAEAFQAQCRGFETRLLQRPCHNARLPALRLDS
jgi:hypothetical protein